MSSSITISASSNSTGITSSSIDSASSSSVLELASSSSVLGSLSSSVLVSSSPVSSSLFTPVASSASSTASAIASSSESIVIPTSLTTSSSSQPISSMSQAASSPLSTSTKKLALQSSVAPDAKAASETTESATKAQASPTNSAKTSCSVTNCGIPDTSTSSSTIKPTVTGAADSITATKTDEKTETTSAKSSRSTSAGGVSVIHTSNAGVKNQQSTPQANTTVTSTILNSHKKVVSTSTFTSTLSVESTFSTPVPVSVTDPSNGKIVLSTPSFVTFTSTITEPNGSSVLVTNVVANPTGSFNNDATDTRPSFLQDHGKTAGVFVVVGVATAGIAAFFFLCIRRRRRRRRQAAWLATIPQHRNQSFTDDRDPFIDPQPQMQYVHDADRASIWGTGAGSHDPKLQSPLIRKPPPAALHEDAGLGLTGVGLGSQRRQEDISPFSDSFAAKRNSGGTANVGMAISRYSEELAHSRPSLTQSSPSIYPASLPNVDGDGDVSSFYEQELGSSRDHAESPRPYGAAALQPPSPAHTTTSMSISPPPPMIRGGGSVPKPRPLLMQSQQQQRYLETPPPSATDSSHSYSNAPVNELVLTRAEKRGYRDVESPSPAFSTSTVAEHKTSMEGLFAKRTLLNVRPRVVPDTFSPERR